MSAAARVGSMAASSSATATISSPCRRSLQRCPAEGEGLSISVGPGGSAASSSATAASALMSGAWVRASSISVAARAGSMAASRSATAASAPARGRSSGMLSAAARAWSISGGSVAASRSAIVASASCPPVTGDGLGRGEGLVEQQADSSVRVGGQDHRFGLVSVRVLARLGDRSDGIADLRLERPIGSVPGPSSAPRRQPGARTSRWLTRMLVAAWQRFGPARSSSAASASADTASSPWRQIRVRGGDG